MSTEQTPTPEQNPQTAGQREITVLVPEDRLEHFQAFYERFLAISERRHRPGAGRRGAGGRGRRGGYRRHHIRRAMFHLAMAEQGPGSRQHHCRGGLGEERTSDRPPAATL